MVDTQGKNTQKSGEADVSSQPVLAIGLQLPPLMNVDRLPNDHDFTVKVKFANGTEVSGVLKKFDSKQETITLVEKKAEAERIIDLQDVLYFRFQDPYVIKRTIIKNRTLAEQFNHQSSIINFHVWLKSGPELSGKTAGSREDKRGIQLYELEKEDDDNIHCFHLYIPKTAITASVIGNKIGEILVDEKKISREELNEALLEQRNNRQEKIGEFLVSQRIVDPEALEAALERQKHIPNLKLGEILISEALISESQLDYALKEQKRKSKTRLGELLIQKGVLSREQLQRCLAKKLGIPFISLKEFIIDPDIIKLIPANIVFNYKVLPLYIFEGNLVVVIEDPLNWEVLEVVRFSTSRQIDPVMASSEEIAWALQFYYSTEDLDQTFASLDDTASGGEKDDSYDASIFSSIESSNITENIVVRVINKIIRDAYEQKVSDIHIEPGTGNQKVTVRFRKDGILFVYYKFPAKYKSAFVSRIKVMANLDISVKFKPQDGKIVYKDFGSLDIELRVATIPTSGGVEDVVIRLLAGGRAIPISGIGLSQSNLDSILDLTSRPHGIFLVCGPTGSGKTTTLHSVLSNLNTKEKKVWTLEDPIEITQPGLRQIPINRKTGMDFATVMRALLRADPDIMMVGEMRDTETASIAIEASLTGHMVLSTLHTNSAAETVVRLLDMGMDEFNFADALLGVLSQRLVSTLCVACKSSYEPKQEELEQLAIEYCRDNFQQKEISQEQINSQMESWRHEFFNDKNFVLYKAVGCKECFDVGYRGRMGVHELLVGTGEIKQMILARAPASEMQREAIKQGMFTCKQDGIKKVLMGFTDYTKIRAL